MLFGRHAHSALRQNRTRPDVPAGTASSAATLIGMGQNVSSITAINRAGWNRIANMRSGLPIERFRTGGICLEPFEVELAGDVEGKAVLQLACSYGDEVLSWANLGATVTGIDISDVAIETARERAARARIKADFRQADMLDLPEELADFDLIYLSWGALCWVPDLAILAGVIAGRLRPGGALLLCEHHPVWEVLAVRGDNQLAVAGDYFGRERPNVDQDDAKRPEGARGEPGAPAFLPFVWPVSDVVMALLNAGLRLEKLSEVPEPGLYGGLGESAEHLPAYYVIKATKQ
jgi:2-polyprenyl-3-methyl-5-hydroxy-6-metoxy-1,4-benzoquinol methylase